MSKVLPALIFLISVLAACSSSITNSNNASSKEDSSYAAVEKNAPNSNYQPAFTGQTRIAGVKTKTAYIIPM